MSFFKHNFSSFYLSPFNNFTSSYSNSQTTEWLPELYNELVHAVVVADNRRQSFDTVITRNPTEAVGVLSNY